MRRNTRVIVFYQRNDSWPEVEINDSWPGVETVAHVEVARAAQKEANLIVCR